MRKIQVLDQITIDKIAAGEVVERPASIVKELTENAIDAGASAITIEIKDGGISLIRISDNGCGIEKEEVPSAFLRHSTSKIRSAEDLFHISSLGFRGEALSSIAAISQVEMITKPAEQEMGIVYRMEGGKEISLEEIGSTNGTSFFIRQMFYNVPARRKFLKTPMTEASYVSDLITRLALSHPEISFRFINNDQTKLHTSGNGQLKDAIYQIYGREITKSVLELHWEQDGYQLDGFIGKPVISRGNRNFETFFVNGRYVRSQILSKAVEDAYKDYTMQHRYPFVVLHLTMTGEHVDVNVHPTKMELRFNNQQKVYNLFYNAIRNCLQKEELIPVVEIEDTKQQQRNNRARSVISASHSSLEIEKTERTPENKPVFTSKSSASPVLTPQPAPSVSSESNGQKDLDYYMKKMRERVLSYHNRMSSAEVADKTQVFRPDLQTDRIKEAVQYRKETEAAKAAKKRDASVSNVPEKQPMQPEQLNLFEEKLLKRDVSAEYTLIGQVFDTYWLVEFHDNLYIIDQHAAHERVLYERTLKQMKERSYTSQYISPPLILDLSMQEAALVHTYLPQFERIGFEIESFGGDSFAVRAVPDNLFGVARKELLLEMIDSLSDELSPSMAPEILDEKIASMSCKAAVKGNSKLSDAEVRTLLNDLLSLDNPYHCPHGRPTIIAMTKRELEKKFKRIV